MKKYVVMLLMHLFIVPYSFADTNIEGQYDIGAILLVLPDHDFIMAMPYGGLTGKYTIKADEVTFTFDDLKLPEFYISELKRPVSAYDFVEGGETSPSYIEQKEQYKKYSELYHPRSDQLLIHFEQGELAESVYIGIQSSEKPGQLQKIYDEKDRCLNDEDQYILIPRQKNMTIVLYRPQDEENITFIRQYFVPDHVNKIMIRTNEYLNYVDGGLHAKIQEKGLIFLDEENGESNTLIEKQALNDVGKESLSFFKAYIRAFRTVEKNKDTLFFKSHPIVFKNFTLNHQALLKKSCE